MRQGTVFSYYFGTLRALPKGSIGPALCPTYFVLRSTWNVRAIRNTTHVLSAAEEYAVRTKAAIPACPQGELQPTHKPGPAPRVSFCAPTSRSQSKEFRTNQCSKKTVSIYVTCAREACPREDGELVSVAQKPPIFPTLTKC